MCSRRRTENFHSPNFIGIDAPVTQWLKAYHYGAFCTGPIGMRQGRVNMKPLYSGSMNRSGMCLTQVKSTAQNLTWILIAKNEQLIIFL